MSPTTKTIAIAAASGAAAALGGILISRLFSAPRHEDVELLGNFGEVKQVVTNYGARLGGLEGRVARLEGRVSSLEAGRYSYREDRSYQTYAPTPPPLEAPRPSRVPAPRQDEVGMARLLRELSGAPPGPDDDPVTRRFQLLEVD